MSVLRRKDASGIRPVVELVTPTSHLGRNFIHATLLILGILVAYLPVYRGVFVWDDLLVVKQNPIVTGDAGLCSVWFQGDFPLTTVVFWLQWQLWGDNPLGYHIVNVLLHALSSLLVWRLLLRLKVSGAWLGAAIYGLHPVCAGSVAWISELKNTLSLPFYLVSIALWLDADTARCLGERTKACLFYGLSLCAFVLALLGKTSTVMLPVVLLGCIWFRHGRVTLKDALRVVPYFVISFVFGLMTIWFQSQHAIKGAVVQTEDIAGRVAAAAMAVWFYLAKAFVPVGLNLIYPRWEINAAALATYIPLVALVGAFAVCWLFSGRWGRAPLFCFGFFTVNLLPVLGLIDMYYLAISRVADHFQYIALIGPAALIGAVMTSVFRADRFRVVVLVLLIVLGGLTFRRAGVFASEEQLWLDVLAKNPNAWPAHNNLGVIRAEQGRLNEAIKHFETALRLKPDNYKAHINFGRALAEQGKFAQAEHHFQAALRISPLDADAHKFYGIALVNQGRVHKAILHLREALRSRPDAETHLYLADAYRGLGRPDAAIAHCRAALRLEPDAPEALNNLAWLLATAHEPRLRNGFEAVQLAERACALTGFNDARCLGTLAAAYAEASRFEDAIVTAEKAIAQARSTGDTKLAKALVHLVQLFRAGKPYHELGTH